MSRGPEEKEESPVTDGEQVPVHPIKPIRFGQVALAALLDTVTSILAEEKLAQWEANREALAEARWTPEPSCTAEPELVDLFDCGQ